MGFSGFSIPGHSGTKLKHRKFFSNQRKTSNSHSEKRNHLNEKFKGEKKEGQLSKQPKEKSMAKLFRVAGVVLLISTFFAIALLFLK